MKNKTLVVLKKELKDIIRDKRTLITSILLPIILYPVLFSILGGTISKATSDAQTDTTVALMGEARNSDVKSFLTDYVFAGNPGIKLVETNDPIEALEKGDVKIVLNIKQGKEYSVTGGNIPFELIYDEDKMASQNSLNYLQSAMNTYNQATLESKLTALGISLAELYPLKLETVTITEIQTGEAKPEGNVFLSMMVPLLMAVFMAMSGMAAAIDIFAGEKERKTLEPLLATKAPRRDILAGKFLAVTISGIFTTTAMMLGMAAGYMLNPSMLNMGISEINISLSVPALLMAVLLVVLMTMVFTGIHVAISAISKNIKEASTYSSFVMMAGMIPGYMTMLLQAGDIKLWMMFVPVYNVLGAMKMVLGGDVKYDFLAAAILGSVAFLLLVLYFVQKLFKRESVMFRM